MLVYLSTYLLLFSVGFIDSINQSRKNNVFFILVLLLICHDGLRWETGTDWDDYYKETGENKSKWFLPAITQMEKALEVLQIDTPFS